MEEFRPVIMIKINDLIMDHDYQRKLNEARAEKIAENFNVSIFDPITVSERPGGKWAVVDGATRSWAAGLKGYVEIPATTASARSVPDEARLFVDKNRGQKRLTNLEGHKAAVVAKDTLALELQSAVDASGWSLTNDLRCIAAMQQAQRLYGIGSVRRALLILRMVIPEGEAAEAWVVGGVARLIGLYPQLNDRRMIKILDKGWTKITRQVQKEGEMGSGNRATICAKIVKTFYNVGLPHGGPSRLPDDDTRQIKS